MVNGTTAHEAPYPLVAGSVKLPGGAVVVFDNLGYDLIATGFGKDTHVVQLPADSDFLAGLVHRNVCTARPAP